MQSVLYFETREKRQLSISYPIIIHDQFSTKIEHIKILTKYQNIKLIKKQIIYKNVMLIKNSSQYLNKIINLFTNGVMVLTINICEPDKL